MLRSIQILTHRLFCTLLLAILFASFSHAEEKESVFRDPVEFLRKRVFDLRLGPGYLAYENVRVYGKDRTGTKLGPGPLYDFRVGPINITNIFDQAGFTKGRGPRLGLLFSYTGDEYDSYGLARRNKTLFGGGFAGWGYLTFYAYMDLLKKQAGAIYDLHFAPAIIKTKTFDTFLVFDLEHMNSLYVDFYYGIRPFEATTRLPQYSGRRATNFSATLLSVWKLSKDLEFTLWGGNKFFGPSVYHSPTMGRKQRYSAGVGFLYRLL